MNLIGRPKTANPNQNQNTMECIVGIIAAAAIASFATYMIMRKSKSPSKTGRSGGGFDKDDERMK